VNHDLRPMMPANGLEEFKSVAAKPVAIGNDNLTDTTAADAFHQGRKPWPLVVESGADVLVELVLWVRLPELFDLSLEVRCLLRARDSGVDDLGLALLTIFTTEERIDVSSVVKALPRRETLDAYLPLVSPVTESGP